MTEPDGKKKQRRKRRVRTFRTLTLTEAEVLVATRRALTKKEWVRLDDIKIAVDQMRGIENPDHGMSKQQISRVFSSIRDLYPDDPERLIITYQVGRETRYQLNGWTSVSRRTTGLLIYTAYCLSMHNVEGITPTELKTKLDEAMGSDKIMSDDEFNDRLKWAKNPKHGAYFTEKAGHLIPTQRAIQELNYFAGLSRESEETTRDIDSSEGKISNG